MAGSAMDEFIPFVMQMLNNAPDANAPTPLVNRQATVYGVTIPFLVLCWVAVAFRLHTRFRVVRDPGLDDAFVVLAAVLNLIGHIGFFGSLNQGVGKHLIYILGILEPTMVWFYVANAAYTTTTVCIKLSLLLQYLRLFRDGYRRTMTLVLLGIVTLWGSGFAFIAWFPCFPVSGFWDKHMIPQAKCYGFGYRTIKEAKDTLFAFSGSNMILDLAVFLIPLTEYFRPGLKRKQVLAMTALFVLASIAVLMAVLRLWSGLKYNNTVTQYDFTWWLPEVLIFSCLEVDFAIMCASVPIFWPTVVAAWTEIFVTQEVTVIHDRRSRFLEYRPAFLELQRAPSLNTKDSTERLKKSTSLEERPWFLSFDPETGKGPGSGFTQVAVQPNSQKARVL